LLEIAGYVVMTTGLVAVLMGRWVGVPIVGAGLLIEIYALKPGTVKKMNLLSGRIDFAEQGVDRGRPQRHLREGRIRRQGSMMGTRPSATDATVIPLRMESEQTYLEEGASCPRCARGAVQTGGDIGAWLCEVCNLTFQSKANEIGPLNGE
jgi:hypothetical protein